MRGLLFGLLLAAAWGGAANAASPPAPTGTARFQIIQPMVSGGHAILIDTSNGNTWRLAVTPGDPAKPLEPGNLLWFWSPLSVAK